MEGIAVHPALALRRAVGLTRFFRVKDWLHFLPLTLVSIERHAAEWSSLGLSLPLAASCLAFAYGYNLLCDSQLTHVPSESVALDYGVGTRTLLGALGVIVALAVALSLALSATASIATALVLSVSYIYSGGPRLKRYPVVGSVANLFIFVPIMGMGSHVHAGGELVRFAYAFGGLLLQNQLLHEMAHREEDIAQGVNTTTVRFGVGAAKAASFMAGLVPVAVFLEMALARHDWRIGAAAGALLVFSLVYLVLGDLSRPETCRRLRLGHRYLGFAAGAAVWLVRFLEG